MAGVSTEELKNRVSIVELVSDYVSLRKAGRSHTGLCPFHDDKNPSLHVSEEKGMFYCFSCKAGGDIFAFLQKIKGCSFKEALNELAERAGLEIEPRPFGRKSGEKDAMFAMNKAVCGFFRNSLNSGSAESGQALSYLKRRGIDTEAMEQFSIGYAPSSGSALPGFLSAKGLSHKIAAKLGLISFDGGSSVPFGRFRGRVIFPIFNTDGQVEGFGGRILNENQRAPKYLNSSESVVYKKRQSLYGLFKTRQEMRKCGTAVLVEGYTDMLSVYSSGLKNVAASLGTALTRHQVGILRRYADDIVILYDGDRAGTDSAFTAGEIFMAAGIVPKIARVPENLDPDQFARQKGRKALRALVDGAKPLTEALMDDIARAISEKKVSQTVAAKRLMGIVPALGDSPETGPYVREVARRFGFRESDLYSVVSGAGKSRLSERPVSEEPERGVGAAEMMLVRIALKFPDIAGVFAEKEVVSHIPDGAAKDIISSICASGIAGSGRDISGASSLLSHAHFTLDTIDFIDEGNLRAEIEKCLVKLKLDAIGRELKSVRERLRAIEEDPESGSEHNLMELYRDLLERKKLVMEDLP